MQSLPIYLYPNTLDVILDLDPDVLGVNRVMYQRDLKIQKGVKNNVQIQFKNSDQKRLPIFNTSTYVFNMFDPSNNKLVLQKQLKILDDTVILYQTQDQTSTGNTLTFSTSTTGISVGQTVSGFGIPPNTIVVSVSTGTVTLNNPTTLVVTSSTSITFNTIGLRGLGLLNFLENDTVNLDRGSYQYSVTYQDPTDGTFEVAYANTYYDIAGTIYLNDQVYPQLQPSQKLSFLSNYNDSTFSYEWKSGNIYAYPEYKSPAALHTMALYMGSVKPFIGTVYIYGTLQNDPNSFGKYALIATREYNGFSGIDYINFNGFFTYVSVKYVPAAAPGAGYNNNDPNYYGSFDYVLYRS
jgi:hypothetical protein